MKILLGPRKKSAIRSDKDNKLVAYHEAGHALASFYAPHADPVKQITILPAGRTGGVTLMMPEEDTLCHTKGEMLDSIVVSLGGRVAEELVLGDISTGASNDIQQATRVATDMVTRYGMSELLGTVLYGSEHSRDEIFLGRDFSGGETYSQETAGKIDNEIRRIIDECYGRCTSYISSHLDKLELVASYLLKHETMEGDTFRAAMERVDVKMEDLEAIDEERIRKSEEENRAAAEKRAEEEKKASEQSHSDAEREMFEALGIHLEDTPSASKEEENNEKPE